MLRERTAFDILPPGERTDSATFEARQKLLRRRANLAFVLALLFLIGGAVAARCEQIIEQAELKPAATASTN